MSIYHKIMNLKSLFSILILWLKVDTTVTNCGLMAFLLWNSMLKNSIESEKFSRGTVNQISLQNFFWNDFDYWPSSNVYYKKKSREEDGMAITSTEYWRNSLPMEFLKSEPDYIPILSCSVKNAWLPRKP